MSQTAAVIYNKLVIYNIIYETWCCPPPLPPEMSPPLYYALHKSGLSCLLYERECVETKIGRHVRKTFWKKKNYIISYYIIYTFDVRTHKYGRASELKKKQTVAARTLRTHSWNVKKQNVYFSSDWPRNNANWERDTRTQMVEHNIYYYYYL